LAQLIAAELPSLVAIRRDLHAHPQLRYQETYASGLVQKELTRLRIPFEAGVAKTGVVAWIVPDGKKSPRAAITLRADMDALPITEETGLSYASQTPGVMHACGHDGHTTILLGTARILSRLRHALPAPVKLFFQPAEEGGAGAAKFVQAGALDERIGGFRVAKIMAVHGDPNREVGTISTMPGPFMAASDLFTITLTGRGGHGAAPQLTADPIVAGAHLVSALQTVVSRNVDPLTPAVLSICKMDAGQAQNVIPEQITLGGTIRTFDKGAAEMIHRRLREISEQTARTYGCACAIDLFNIVPATVNDPRFTEQVLAFCRRIFGSRAVIRLTQPRMGAEDFSYYAQQVPGCFVYVGLCPRGEGPRPGLHTPQFDFNDDALAVGIKLMCSVTLAGL
jgi:amidohydrolase